MLQNGDIGRRKGTIPKKRDRAKREAKKMLGRKKKLNSKQEKLASLFIDQIAVNDNCQVFV